MLDKLIHVNNAGEILEIGKGIILNYSTLRDFGDTSKSLPFIIFDNEKTIDLFFEHFEKDILANKDGYFEVNGYKIYGRITKIKNSEYLIDKRYIKRDVTFETSTKWIKEISKVFKLTNTELQDEINQKEYTYRYPFIYNSVKGIGTLVNSSHFKTDGIIKFYGDASNPFVKIGNNVYQINTTINKDEYIVINTKLRTIKKIDIVGNETNIFVFRNKSFNAFEMLPSGTSVVTWDPSYTVEVIIVEERGEAKWL